jgi:alpha-L-fucosidase 2
VNVDAPKNTRKGQAVTHGFAGTLICALHVALGPAAVSGAEVLYATAGTRASPPADTVSYLGPNDRIEDNLPSSSTDPTATPAGWDPQPSTRGKVVDWQVFMRRHDMVFDRLPRNWTEAPHFGNAMVGSMLYQDGNALKLQIFRADVHDHRDDTWGWTAYSRPRLQIGHFTLEPVGKLTGCSWRKDLWNAELTGTVVTDLGEIRIRHFTHAMDMAIVTELTPTAGEQAFRWTWHPAEARTTRGGYPTRESEIAAFANYYGAHYQGTLNLYQPNPSGRQETNGQTSLWIQDVLAGGQYATAWAEKVRGETRIHIVSIANSYPKATAGQTAMTDVKRFIALERTTWVRHHRAWWHNYYTRSFVTIPDKGLESLYWQTIYRFGCTSRAGRCIVDTPGIWFQGKSWPYFTADWNIQSALWPVYAANRLEQGQALVDRLYEQRGELAEAVRPVEWQEDSAYLPLAVAWDMRGSREGDMRYYDLVGNLPWAMNNCWSQYRYSMDDAMLREKIYPVLRRSINLYLHMVREEPDGKLHLPPTYSPETGAFAECNFDLALFKWGCLTLLRTSHRLGIPDPLIPRWKDVVKRLPDFPADEHGYRLGRDQTSPADHQHFSHLLMIYPLHLANLEQPDVTELLRRSFSRARDNAGPGQRQAMVQAHVGPLAAALGLGDEALESLKRLQGDLYPNGLWYETPCVESSLAAANIVQDMLIQSWSDPTKDDPGLIRIFPALPSSWKDVEFHDLRAEGAFLVSAKRAAGRTEWVRIKSLAGEPCRVRPGLPGKIRLTGDRVFKLQALLSDTFQIDLKRGETVLLHSGTERLPRSGKPSPPRLQ